MTGISLRRWTTVLSFFPLGLMLLNLPMVAHAAMTITTDAQKFHGEMIDATINTVTIDDHDGGYTIVPRTDIVSVEIDVYGSTKLTRAFHDWRDGICILKTGDRLIGVQDGLVKMIVPAEPQEILPSGGP